MHTAKLEIQNHANKAQQPAFAGGLDDLVFPAYILAGTLEEAADCVIAASEKIECDDWNYDLLRRKVIETAVGRKTGEIVRALNEDTSDDEFGIPEELNDGWRNAEENLSSARFVEAMLALNLFHRAVLVLCLYEGFSLEEAALLLHVPQSVVHRERKRALARLLSELLSPETQGINTPALSQSSRSPFPCSRV